MDEPILETTATPNTQGYIQSIQKLGKTVLGMVVMFIACLLICHSPALSHIALRFLSP